NSDLRVAVLARVHVEHEGDERSLEPRQISEHDGEAGPAQLTGALEIEARAGEVVLRLGGEIEARLLPPWDALSVVVLGRSNGSSYVREVRDRKEALLELSEHDLQLFFAGLERLGDRLELFAARGEGCLVRTLRELAHLVVRSVPPRGEGLGLADETAPLLRELTQRIDGRTPGRVACSQARADEVEMFGDESGIQHGFAAFTTSALP